VKLIGSASERLRDAKYVEGVLCGKQKSRAGDWRRLRGLLERIVEWWEKKDKDPRKVIGRMKSAYLVHQVALAHSPKQLITMYGIISKMERSIEEKRRQLNRR